jgi:hypothetical protein
LAEAAAVMVTNWGVLGAVHVMVPVPWPPLIVPAETLQLMPEFSAPFTLLVKITPLAFTVCTEEEVAIEAIVTA